MQYVVLLGAGFSRNWGGWLASEAFEYLLGTRELDARTKSVLWKYKDRGGFEDALADLQDDLTKRKNADAGKRLELMQKAISQMFQDMDQAFADIEFEQQQFRGYTVARFLTRFDAIFTLNQDTLLERRYVENVPFLSEGRWTGYQFPGMGRHPGQNPIHDKIGTWSPASDGEVQLNKNLQPLIKLHGSWNWTTGGGHPLLIMGGNKAREISQHSILSWNFDRFREFLGRPEIRLMVIGYSFRDPHVNQIIFDAVDRGHIELFIIDPLGVDVLNENRNPVALITAESPQFQKMKPSLIGASRRSMREIFGFDRAEFGKVMRFFQ